LLQEAEEPFTAKVCQLLVDVTSLANGNERNVLLFSNRSYEERLPAERESLAFHGLVHLLISDHSLSASIRKTEKSG